MSGQVFFRKLFPRRILRDKDIVAAAEAKASPKRGRNSLSPDWWCFRLTLFVGMVVSFFGNKALIAEAKERADELERAESPTPNDDRGVKATSGEMAAMERLRETLSKAAGEGDFPPFWLRFGLYSGGRLNADDSSPFIYFGRWPEIPSRRCDEEQEIQASSRYCRDGRAAVSATPPVWKRFFRSLPEDIRSEKAY